MQEQERSMNFSHGDTKPLPLVTLHSEHKLEDRRLWLGNLDSRVTEYQLIKLLQQYGTIEKFDLLFHRSGPLTGQPRGYAFATYGTPSDAHSAKDALDTKMVGCKRLVVRWANSITNEDLAFRHKPELEIPVLAGANKVDKNISPATKIQAIEAKLKMMEHSSSSDSFEVSDTPSVSAAWPVYQYSSGSAAATSSSQAGRYRGRGRYDSRPYRRPYRHRR